MVGGGSFALTEALFLTKFCRKVYLIHRRQGFRAEKILQERVLANDKIELILDAVIEKINGGYKVTVGSTLHPMEQKHYIEWIELLAGDKTYRQFLNPGDAPEAVFNIEATEVTAREHCNVHGLWKALL